VVDEKQTKFPEGRSSGPLGLDSLTLLEELDGALEKPVFSRFLSKFPGRAPFLQTRKNLQEKRSFKTKEPCSTKKNSVREDGIPENQC